MSEQLREVVVNGVRFFQAEDVARWHRGATAKAEEWDALEAECAAAKNVIEQLLDPQCEEEHATHGRWVGNRWERVPGADCALCEYDEACQR